MPSRTSGRHLTVLSAFTTCCALKSQVRQHNPKITITTVETRIQAVTFPMPGVPGKQFLNLGYNKSWDNLFTKPKIFLPWLQSREDPEEIVVFADGADVMYGGCSDEELLDLYRRVVAVSGGARVLMGAEMGLDPPPLGAMTDPFRQFETRRHDVQGALSLTDESYGGVANCEISRKKPEQCYTPTLLEAQAGHWPCAGPCSFPPSLTYLNSGFIIGPVRDLIGVIEGMLKYENVDDISHKVSHGSPFFMYKLPPNMNKVANVEKTGVYNWHDQGAATMYMAEHPDKLSIDYTGSLVLNLHQLPLKDILDVHPDALTNKVTGRVTCFLHANGPSLGKLNRTLVSMAQSSTKRRAQRL